MRASGVRSGNYVPPRPIGAPALNTQVAARTIHAPSPTPPSTSRTSIVARVADQPETAGSRVAAVTPSTSTAPVACFAALYTKRSNKKRKAYDDGVVAIKANKVFLYDSSGAETSAARYRAAEHDRLGPGSEIEIGSMEVEIVGAVDSASFMSGRVFIAPGTLSAPSEKPSVSLPDAPAALTRAFARPTAASAPESRPKEDRHPNKVVPRLHTLVSPLPREAFVLCAGANGNPDIVVDPALASKLRPHQREGVRFLFECVSGMRRERFDGRGCVLADDMGLGKTLQTITLIWTMLKQSSTGRTGVPFARKAVVVCPASLVDNWAREVAKWLGPTKLIPITVNTAGEAAKTAVRDFCLTRIRPLLIISYETYRNHAPTLSKCDGLDLLVCDEGHRLKSADGNKTIAALASAPTLRRVVLTGTPLQNRLDEFYAVVSFVNPNALGRDATQFKRVFQTPIEKGRDKGASKDNRELAKARAEELSSLVSGFVLRRTSDVNREFLPAKHESVVFCRLTSEQMDLYEQFLADNISAAPSSSSGVDVLRLIVQLKQICTHPLLSSSESASKANGFRLEDIKDSGKLIFVDALLREVRVEDSSDKVVIASCSTSTLGLLEGLCKLRGYGVCRLDGATPAKVRQQIVNQFNRPATATSTVNSFVFLLSAKAGGCGLNLIGANRLVLMDPDWNPAVDLQVMARIWRDGQTKPCFIYRLLATGSIEERVYQRQALKTHVAQSVFSNQAESSSNFSRAELKDLFALRRDTDCDTYDLLSSSGEEAKKKIFTAGWRQYEGSQSIDWDDHGLAKAVQHLEAAKEDVVSWIQTTTVDPSRGDVVEPLPVMEEGDSDGMSDEDASLEESSLSSGELSSEPESTTEVADEESELSD